MTANLEKSSTFTLNNGVPMPVIGLGVYQSAPEETVPAVEWALETGYRLVDTAAAYGNEKEVGQGIRNSGLAREDVFVESKVWISDFGHQETLHAWEKATAKLGLEQLDLLILHQALPTDVEKTLAAYRALEELLEQGKVRAIGVSNFMVPHLEQLLSQTDVVPAVNQIESHPYFRQAELQEFHRQHGILTQAWSPIGGITSYRGIDGKETSTLNDPVITEIAEAHGKTPAQIMLRWHLQQGVQVIPKSVKEHRIRENFDVFDVELSEEDIGRINALDGGQRGGPEPEDVTLQEFGFPIPEA